MKGSISSLSAEKQCASCQNLYPRSTYYFHRDKGRRDGLCHRCKQCAKEHRRKHYQEHHEHYRKYARIHAEQCNQHNRKYRLSHKEKVKCYNAQYRAKNYERVLAWNRRREALRRGAIGTYTIQQIQEQYERQKGACYYCKVKVGKKYHIDHVVPISRGGSNDISNLVISCPTCNLRKNDKLPHEWLEGGRLL